MFFLLLVVLHACYALAPPAACEAWSLADRRGPMPAGCAEWVQSVRGGDLPAEFEHDGQIEEDDPRPDSDLEAFASDVLGDVWEKDALVAIRNECDERLYMVELGEYEARRWDDDVKRWADDAADVSACKE